MAPVPPTFNFADVWEAVAPRVADRTALVCGDERRTYGELAERVNRLARHLRSIGVAPGEHVGICMPNRVEWLETFLAAFTVRAVPVNLNHRYTATELIPLLRGDGATTIVFDASTEHELSWVASKVGNIRHRIRVGPPAAHPDGVGVAAENYEVVVAAQRPEPLHVAGRSGDDHYVIYTGGTTGRPKGVVWRQEDAFFACIGGGDPTRLEGAVQRPEQVIERISHAPLSYLPVAPLMHAAAQWTTMSWLFAGGQTTLMPGSLDPEAVWQAVQDEAVNMVTVVGDAVGRPLMDMWDTHPGRWDVSSLLALSNGGAPMSPALKARIAATFPSLALVDGFGSSETGAQGSQRLQPGDAGRSGGLTRFRAYADTVVLDEDLRPVEPGSGAIGRVGLRGRIPLGYHNDPEKTGETFVEVAGARHVLTGDMATVEADGTIALLGRGSQCINTGGEKVFPEEVEAALHGHPAVADVLVTGVPDERWGSAVVAVVQPKAGADPPTLDELRAHGRPTLAGYKLPKRLVLVDEVRRSPAGKADYRWAAKAAQ
jgi:acyl-CoA synthetase (AMP-forming)/AMP-acid ligase II